MVGKKAGQGEVRIDQPRSQQLGSYQINIGSSSTQAQQERCQRRPFVRWWVAEGREHTHFTSIRRSCHCRSNNIYWHIAMQCIVALKWLWLLVFVLSMNSLKAVCVNRWNQNRSQMVATIGKLWLRWFMKQWSQMFWFLCITSLSPPGSCLHCNATHWNHSTGFSLTSNTWEG